MSTTTTIPAEAPTWVRAIAPNRWYGQLGTWHDFRYVVLSEFANGWHVGFTSDPAARQDYYWHSGISEARARELFAMAAEAGA